MLSLREENRPLSLKAFIFTPQGAATAVLSILIFFGVGGFWGFLLSAVVFGGSYKLISPKATDIKKDMLNNYFLKKLEKERTENEAKKAY